MIELADIEKRFGDLAVLKRISLRFGEGSVTTLIGPSGGGKRARSCAASRAPRRPRGGPDRLGPVGGGSAAEEELEPPTRGA